MGPEPKHLNEFLKPAVDELKALWKRIRLQSIESKHNTISFQNSIVVHIIRHPCISKALRF